MTGLLNSFMNSDFYILYWFMYHISIFNRSDLYVAEIYANQGPTLKRIRPAAKGSAVRIRKRTSHITIVLRESK